MDVFKKTSGLSAIPEATSTTLVGVTPTMSVNAPATASSEQDRLMHEREAAALLGYSPRALQNWRLRGGGPVFVKVSERSVRYQHSDLIAWITARRRTRTADPGPPPNDR